MKQPGLTVIKVGGSLFGWPELPRRLAAFLDGRNRVDPGDRVVLIAGGGAVADCVRLLDQTHTLGDQSAHRLALHAMDLTALLLAAICPGAVVVDRTAGLNAAWSAGSFPIFAPRRLLEEAERSGQDPLPASWDVTSDTIAAWAGVRLAADRLILIKSAPLPAGVDRHEAARLGLIDRGLAVVARPGPWVQYLNLRDSACPLQLLP
jgi:aspartokinase-like uncharacterized kinase